MAIYPKCLALAFSLLILLQAYVVRKLVGTWLFPACLFGLFWFLMTFIPLAVLFSVPVDPWAIGFIFLCLMAFSISSLFFDWKSAFEKNDQKHEVALVYGSPFLKAAFYLFPLSSLVFLVINSLAQGFSLYDLVFNLFASASTYADMRYSESLTVNIFGQLSIVFAYLGVILGGLTLPCTPTRTGRWRIIVLAFLPSIFVAVTQSAKGMVFLCVAFFYAGILVYRVSVGRLRLFEKGSIKSLTLYAATLGAIATISFMSRGLSDSDDYSFIIDKLISYFASYSFSHIYAFSDWFSCITGGHSEISYVQESATHGFYTFMALFRLMGSDKVVPLGVYDDYYTYGEVLMPGNIYTVFRGLIMDFGFIGTVVFVFVAGLLSHWAFYAMLRNKRPTVSVSAFVLMVGYFYMSFGISLLTWNNIYVTFALLWIILQINKLITQPGGLRVASLGPPAGAVQRLRHSS